MTTAADRPAGGRRTLVLLGGLLALAALAWSFRLGEAPLLDVDEATYAEIARRMVESGDWIVPQFRDKPSYLKPPFYYWSVAASYLVLGVSEFAVRFVSFLYGCGALALTFLIARRFLPVRESLLAALLLALSPGTFMLVRSSTTDMTLACLIALALYGYVRGYHEPERRPDLLAFLALWGGAALATLTKGPIGIGIPFTVILFYLLASRRAREFGRLSWLPGLPLWAAIVLPWYVLCYLRLEDRAPGGGMEFLRRNLVFHNLQKFFEAGHYADRPGALFLLYSFLWMFFPWVLPFLVGIVRRLWHRLRTNEPLSSVERLSYLWLFYPLAVFSFSKFKMPTYLAPLLAAAAIGTAPSLVRWMDGASDRAEAATVRWSLWLALLGATTVAFLGLASFFPHPSRWVRVLPLALGVLALGACILLARTSRRLAALCVAALGVVGAFVFTAGYLQPRIAAYAPYREIGRLARERMDGKHPLVVYRTGVPASLRFYARLPTPYMTTLPELDGVLAGKEGALILVEETELSALDPERRARLAPIGRWPQFHVAKLSGEFLSARTRPRALKTLVLCEIIPAQEPS